MYTTTQPGGYYYYPIFQIKKLRYREINTGNTATMWQRGDLNPGSLAPDTISFSITTRCQGITL